MIETIFIILSLFFAFGFLLVTFHPKAASKRGEAWKPALLSVACAIAAMVAIGCL